LSRHVDTKKGTYVVTDLIKLKDNGNVHRRTGHEDPEG